MKRPRLTKEDRIAKYLEAIPGGDRRRQWAQTNLQSRLARFTTDGRSTKRKPSAWLKVYNAKCDPPWSDKELKHKARDAAKARHEKPRGYLLAENGSTFGKEAPDWTLPTKAIGVWKDSGYVSYGFL